ncbi:MAG TPA: hypothetical protein VHG91_14490 [Longimicrobium sp.]|nr:hypothetical protein [Longimicrobium sp.]
MDGDVRFYGSLVSPEGLEPVARWAERGPVPVHVWTSGFDGTARLRSGDGPVHLDMDSGQGPRYLFSGTVDSGAEEARRLLGAFSAALARGGVVHRIEAEADGGRLGYFHHRWPEGAAAPDA